MIEVDVNNAFAVREVGYKALIRELGFEDTIKFIKGLYRSEENTPKPDITFEQFLNEIEKYR